jgi:hypothetical protein
VDAARCYGRMNETTMPTGTSATIPPSEINPATTKTVRAAKESASILPKVRRRKQQRCVIL